MPEGILTARGPVPAGDPDGGGELAFTWPEAVPWSALGGEFTETWGHDEHGKMTGEHVEITGQSGSGKSYALATILQQRARRWGTAELIIVTKEQDDSVPLLGWPVVDKFTDLKQYRWAVYWPHTSKQGADREKYHEARIYDLLTRLWTKDANIVIAFDEIGYVEDLSRRLKKQIRMMWREARSHKISIVAMKQRPIGVVRDQHSESRWKIVFPPADFGDMDRFAELLGRPRDWAPVLSSLNQQRHEFVIRNNFLRTAYISWIDTPLRPVESQVHQPVKSTHETLYGRRGERRAA